MTIISVLCHSEDLCILFLTVFTMKLGIRPVQHYLFLSKVFVIFGQFCGILLTANWIIYFIYYLFVQDEQTFEYRT